MVDSDMSFDSANLLTFPRTFTRIVQNHEWTRVALSVKEVTKQLGRDERGKVLPETLHHIAHVLHEATKVLQHDKQAADVLTAITDCFKFLRNACAVHQNVQKNIVNTTVFNTTSAVLGILCNDVTFENELLCVKAIIQFMGNAVVRNAKNQGLVWEILQPHFKELLSNADDSLVNFSCMVLYNILIGESDAALKFTTENIALLLRCYFSGSEFAMFVMEYILGKESLLEEVYPVLENEHRLQVLDAVWSILFERENNEEEVKFPLPNVLFLVDQLKQRADCVLTIVEEGVTAEPREMLRLLDVVACASSQSQYLASLQADRSLLISVACLLKNVNEIGKAEGGNVFSTVQRLSEMKLSNESVQGHPVFGFKVSLVCLIGNLCHQNVDNQNQVRELDCIPAVLDTCNIDVYNPLLLQWSILAVRNLLENNIANQQVVASLIGQGPASNAVLRELGLELHQDEGGILNIAPFKRL